MAIRHIEAHRIYTIMKKCCPEHIAKAAAFGCVLPQNSSPEARIIWAKHLCATLSPLGEEKVKAIRMACRCSLKWENIHDAKTLFVCSNSLEDFVVKARQQLGVNWEIKDGSLFVTYTVCSCPMVNENREPLPRAWCYCTLGYNRDYFSEVFNMEVDVELLRAIKLGDQICLIKVTQKSL